MPGRNSERPLTFVINTNIIISALVGRKYTYELILSGGLSLYTPKAMIREVLDYIDEIAERSGLSRSEVIFFLNTLLEYIIIVDERIYVDKIAEAYEVCKKFDEKDAPFVALALKLGIPIWSNDKDLKEKQNLVSVFTTKEINNLLRKTKA